MASETGALTHRGIGGSLNWLVSGSIGGFAGALIFGALLWVVEPTTVTKAIPEMYGFNGGGTTGWMFHLLHGVIFGIIFTFVITRDFIIGILTADIETPVLDALSLSARFIGAGFVYGLAVWVFGPGIILATLVSVGDMVNPLPLGSVYTLLGHLLYGGLVGAVVTVLIDVEIEAYASNAPFDEEPGGSSGGRR